MNNDVLGKLVRSSRKLEQRTTKSNRESQIAELNKYSKSVSMPRVAKNTSVKELNKIKKDYIDRIGYDILTQSVQKGNTTLASVYSKDLKKSKDKDTAKLAKFAPQLAEAKHQSDRHLKPHEKAFLEKGNQNILGYGSENVMAEFDNAKNIAQINKLVDKLKTQDPKKEFYDKNIETFNRVFQKIEGVREDDLNKVREHIKNSNFFDVFDKSNYLLQSLEMYGSDQIVTGAGGDDETELANARLNDLMIRFDLKGDEKRKTSKVLKKYKERTDKAREKN